MQWGPGSLLCLVLPLKLIPVRWPHLETLLWMQPPPHSMLINQNGEGRLVWPIKVLYVSLTPEMERTAPYRQRYGSLKSRTKPLSDAIPQSPVVVFPPSTSVLGWEGAGGHQGPDTWERWPGLPCSRTEETARICSVWTVWVFYIWKMYVQLNGQLEAYATARGGRIWGYLEPTAGLCLQLILSSRTQMQMRTPDPPVASRRDNVPSSPPGLWIWILEKVHWLLSGCWEFSGGNKSILHAEIIYSFILFVSLFTFIWKMLVSSTYTLQHCLNSSSC